jgi:hypothetical protein
VSRDFLATLATTLSWERNAGIEYITEVPAPMTETRPFYTDVQAGDIVSGCTPRDVAAPQANIMSVWSSDGPVGGYW